MPNTSERTESLTLPIPLHHAMDTNDYYALLDLTAEFTPEELGAAYKAAMPRVLSDVARDSPEAKALTTAIDDAFQTFTSESKRRDYDSAHPEYRREAEMRRPTAGGRNATATASPPPHGRIQPIRTHLPNCLPPPSPAPTRISEPADLPPAP